MSGRDFAAKYSLYFPLLRMGEEARFKICKTYKESKNIKSRIQTDKFGVLRKFFNFILTLKVFGINQSYVTHIV